MAPNNTAIVGLASGTLGQGLLNVNAKRPYFDPSDGNCYVIVNQGAGRYGKQKVNAEALLRYDEWKDIDRTVIEAAAQRLVGIADLRNRGLEHNLGSIGVTISLWETQGDMTEADVSMDPTTRGEKDLPAFNNQQVPVPIVHKDFGINLRRLEASRRLGEGLDVTAAAIAGRLVAERTERMLFLGAGVRVEGSTIYGYLTHPNRNIVEITPWTPTAGADIVDDIQQGLTALRADRFYGPFMVYIPAGYETILDGDYRDNDDRTIRERVLALNGVEDIQVADFLPPNNIVIVQLTRDVVDLAIAQDITTVQWNVMGGMQEEFKVMAVWVPRLKADGDGRSGIVHLRPAP